MDGPDLEHNLKVRRKAAISQTMTAFTKDITDTKTQPPRPPKEKIMASIGKPVTLASSEIRLDENIRSEIDTCGLDFLRLRESIKRHGILQSILVEVRETASNYELVCVEGHRRLLAIQDLGIDRVPCILKSYPLKTERTNAALAATLKEELHPLDRAEAFSTLVSSGTSIEEIASQHEREVRTVRRYLKMARWPEDLKRLIRQHKDQFSTRFLFQKLAQTELNHEQLRKIVLERIREPASAVKKKQKQVRRSFREEGVLVSYFRETLNIPAKLKFKSGKRLLEVDISDKQALSRLRSLLDTPEV